MTDSVLLRQPVPQPLTLDWDPRARINFRHPGYDSPFDTLFQLPRFDHKGSLTSASAATDHQAPGTVFNDIGNASASTGSQTHTIAGVHHRTALLACQIIANNAFDGFLATDRDGQQRVNLGPDEVLTADNYWFIANRPDSSLNLVDNRDVYPIVPSFPDWAFPHDRFRTLGWGPQPRPHGQPATAAPQSRPHHPAGQDEHPPHPLPTPIPMAPPPIPGQTIRRCILSNTSYPLHKAHIIPLAHQRWFGNSGMAMYGLGSGLIDNDANALHMRHDLHFVWDAHIFALVPKEDYYTVHVLHIPQTAVLEFAALWHNVPVRSEELRQSEAFMFAKFAQAIFMLLKPFIVQSATSRYVARLQVSPDDLRNAPKVQQEWIPGSSLWDLYGGGGSRSASASRKRSHSKASDDPGNGDAGTRRGLYNSDSEDERTHEWYGTSDDIAAGTWESDSGDEYYRAIRAFEEAERGRPTKRRR
ncbi:hypothetical protein DHEL01_v209912 [Diaporthe helianthi]|uniref:HNH nuclease domain-containing protein n=1 Tax=Diaporthe helianthi TaxID=158607 RepID=A0A2P5HN60_DIAHE|nr:hypothetical protein DHEL01_v209912 [Diaporthe helianthi]